MIASCASSTIRRLNSSVVSVCITNSPFAGAESDVRSSLPRPSAVTPIVQDRQRRVAAGGAEHAAGGIGAGAAEVEAAHRRAVATQPWQRPEKEQLVDRDIQVHRVATEQSDSLLRVERRPGAYVEDRLRQVRDELGH